jgi:hypothetical protein
MSLNVALTLGPLLVLPRAALLQVGFCLLDGLHDHLVRNVGGVVVLLPRRQLHGRLQLARDGGVPARMGTHNSVRKGLEMEAHAWIVAAFEGKRVVVEGNTVNWNETKILFNF